MGATVFCGNSGTTRRGSREVPEDVKANITAVQAAGFQVWTYISMQPYKPFPDWRLDNPVIDCRALFWMVRAFGFDGLLLRKNLEQQHEK